MNILFLSVSVGSGHMKAAESLKKYIENTSSGSRCIIVDTLKYVNPVFHRLIVGSYLSTVKKTPQLYGKLYRLSEASDNINDVSKSFNNLLSFRLKNLINNFNPDVIVCTHPFPLHMVSNLKRKNMISIPIVTIITDYVTHSLWVHDNVDAFIVAHECMKQEFGKKGINPDNVYPLGIPVSSDFLRKGCKKKLLNEFGLENKLTILIMGGSLGFGEVSDTLKALLECERDLQIIAVAGNNMKLKQQLEECCHETHKTVKILGFTDRIADLMEVSDLIISKPGGMTITEALVKQLPMLVISPIPGQEEGNAHFLLNNGVAARIYPNDDMDSILHQIIDNPLRNKQMKEMAAYISRPNSCSDIFQLLEAMVNNCNTSIDFISKFC